MGKHKEKEGIVLLNDHMLLAEKLLTDGECGRLYRMLRRYSMEGILSDTTLESGAWQAVFEMMRSAQDKANQRYEETCERNRLRALKRYANAAQADEPAEADVLAAAGSYGSCGSLGSAGSVGSMGNLGSLGSAGSCGSLGGFGSDGSQSCQSNQNKTNQNKSKQIKSNAVIDPEALSERGQETKGVVGVVWM